MSEVIQQAPIPDLLRFRDDLELGDGLFQEITGLSVSSLFAYRRGRLKQKPQISLNALHRMERTKEVLRLGLEMIGNQEKALDWVYTESPNFNGQSPMDLAASRGGLDSVRAYIAKLRAAVGTIANACSKSAAKPDEEFDSPVPANLAPVVQEVEAASVVRPIDINADLSAKLINCKANAKSTGKEGPKENAAKRNKTKETLGAGLKKGSTKLTKPKAADAAPPPPTGIALGTRVFRIKDALAEIRARRSDLSLKALSELMVERGFKQFASVSFMSRLANSYTWATWEEVVGLADLLGVDAGQLGKVYSQSSPHP